MGLSLEQVFREIHIRPRYLEALENDRMSDLPSEVQGRGFLSIYAGFLHLNISPDSDVRDSLDHEIQADAMPDLETALGSKETPVPSDQILVPFQVETTPPQVANFPPLDISTSRNIFMNVGTNLRQRREALGLSLQDIEQSIHVKEHYLAAVENGRVDLLPSTVQGRGMISNYANFLELDTDNLLLQFAEGLQLQRQEHILSENKRPTGSRHSVSGIPFWRRLASADLFLVSALVLFLMGFSIWSLIQVSRDREGQPGFSAPPISEMLLSTDMQPMTPSLTPEEMATSSPQEVNDTPEISREIIVNTSPAGIPNLDTLPLQVYIIANQRAWMRVTVDGKVSFEGRVLPGNAYPFSGSKKIELLAGNGSALQVYFNQADLGILGNVGQVSERVFSAEGVLTPTPKSSPTPTSTQVPTLTLVPTPTVPTATVTPYIP